MAHWVQHMNHCGATVLAVDVPTGLHAETGALTQSRTEPASHTRIVVRAHHTLSLLTLKPGLFTGHGRDFVGQVEAQVMIRPYLAGMTNSELLASMGEICL